MDSMHNLKSMNDVALKPRLLLALIKEDVPNDKKLFDNPSKLSRVVSIIHAHKLLSESASHSVDPKLAQRWKLSVDEWCNRLLLLVSNASMPDKRWAGISLIGVTCRECSSSRFLATYAVWYDNLLVNLQSLDNSQFVKVASCASMLDLITRLSGFPNTKKEGTLLVGKLIQPLLNMLKENASEALWDRAINVLTAAITLFPASLHRHYDSVEDTITLNILSGKCSVDLLKKLAHCVALLPKSKGDENSWLLLLRKILLLINSGLSDIFHGLEKEGKWDEAIRLLIPPGEAIPHAIWGQNLLEEFSDKDTKRAKLASISTWMLCCCAMLTNSYPVQVNVPVRALLALVERVLMVNGSLPHGTSSYMIAMEQDFICSELPVLHSYCLDLLASIVKGMRSQLLPHAAYTVRLVKEYFRRCELPELRVKAYTITKLLLISMGTGIAIYLGQEVVNNSFVDLNPVLDRTFGGASTKAFPEPLLQPCNKKRKHGATPTLDSQHDGVGLEAEAATNYSTAQIAVKTAALEALKTLLTVGGASKSESWRAKVDNLLITVATESFKWCGWAHDGRISYLLNGPMAYADFQLAALQALLASLLSPSQTRPPHLARGLELFRRGKQDIGTKVSEFCAHALLALEVVIHPRGLPLSDLISPSSFPGTNYAVGQDHGAPFSSGMQGIGNSVTDSDDPLYDSWLDSSKENEDFQNSSGNVMDAEKPMEAFRVEKIHEIDVSSAKSPRRSEQEPNTVNACAESRGHDDKIMNEQRELLESAAQLQDKSSRKHVNEVTTDDEVIEVEPSGVPTDADRDREMASTDTVTITKDDRFTTRAENNYPLVGAQKDKAVFTYDSDNDSDDSMPSIFLD